MLKTMTISKGKIGFKLGVIKGQEMEGEHYRNIVLGWLGEQPVLISTNLSKEQWNKLCHGLLSRKELQKLHRAGQI